MTNADAPPLTVPDGAALEIQEETRIYGERRLETGGFLLAPCGTDAVSGVALAGDTGIVRAHNVFQISARALDRLFTFVDENGLWVPAQFHSHQCAAFMSYADAEHGLRAEGFISAIVPRFGDPPSDIGCWGWWQFRAGDWRDYLPDARQGEIKTRIYFDEEGVRDR